jgi:hypothetical protein
MDKKDIFLYRVVNDRLDVAKSVFELLMSALYAEELLGKNTKDLVENTLSVTTPPQASSFPVKTTIATLIAVGTIAAGAFFFMRKKQQ